MLLQDDTECFKVAEGRLLSAGFVIFCPICRSEYCVAVVHS